MAAAILLSTTLGSASAADSKASDESAKGVEGPKSDWDFAIYGRDNESFPKFAVGRGFSAYLADRSDAGSVLRVEDEDGLALEFGLRPLANGTAAVESVRASAIETADTKADFEGAWGSLANISYVVGYNGIKEAVTLSQRPAGSGDLFVPSLATFDQDALTPRVNGSNLTGYAHWAGDIVFADKSGDERFRIPQAYVQDAGGPKGQPPKTLWLEYQLERRGGTLMVSAVVPEKFLNDSNLRWPLTVDPTVVLPTLYSGQDSYSDCDIFMESSLYLLSYSSLTLTRCAMYFNGNYLLSVAPDATLSLTDSAIASNSSTFDWAFTMDGNLELTRSAVRDTADGIQMASSQDIVIQGSLIADSAGDGIAVLVAPSSFRVNNTTIQNVSATGVSLEPWGAFDGLVNNSVIADAGIGIAVVQTNSGVVAHNVTILNASASAVSFDTSAAGVEAIAIRNATTAFNVQGGTAFAGNSTVSGAQTGVSCSGATLTLDQLAMRGVTGTAYSASNCAGTWVDGNYYAWSRSLAASSLEVRHRLNILLLNKTDSPLATTSLAFYDTSGQSAAPTAPTNAAGWLNETVLTEFVLDSAGSYTFKTPNRIDVMVSGTPSVHYYVGGKRAITIHATTDADQDGIPTAWEDQPQNATWIEAEYKARADGQFYNDLHASGDTALRASADGTYFTDLGWPVLSSGTYQFLLRAAGNGLGASLNISAHDTIGNTILSTENHPLTSAYSWAATQPFTLTSSKSVILNASSYVPVNSTFLTAEAVLLDKIAVVRLKDGASAIVGYAGGQMSDPLDNDTDFDGLVDGYESNGARGWYEAEVLATSAPKLQEELASSGVAVQHPTGTGVVLTAALYRLTVTPSSAYQLYVRVRSLTGGAVNASLQLNDGLGPPATSTVVVGPDWVWVAGPTLTTGANAWQFNVTVIDLDDPNQNDAAGYLAVDEVAALKTSTFDGQPGWFNATSPMDGDADRDGLEDGPEVDGFFPADIIQAENYTSAAGMTPIPLGVRFESSASWANYSVDVRYTGEYRFLIEPLFEVNDGGGWTIPYDTLEDMLVAEVRDASQAVVSPIFAGLPAFNYSNLSPWDGQWAQVGAFFDGRFNLTSGSYSIKLTINGTKVSQLGVKHFRISIDAFYVQKYRLNATLWDFDSDFVPDGFEVNHSMLPLRADSDYDTLDDFEETRTGADGFVTSATSNDTDLDGVLDPVEVGASGDADNGTRTDPTNPDGDADALPDGWVDGWEWFANESRYRRGTLWQDGIRQPWEGEDLDGDGAVNTDTYDTCENWESGGGEPDPNLPDTDGDTMGDGWEVAPRDHSGTLCTLDPRVDDASGDPDWDGLYNFGEYAALTNPFDDDTDGDLIRDGDETRVFFRTSVADGALNTSGYTNLTTSDWVFYDLNSYDMGGGSVFNFSGIETNLSADSGFSPNRTVWIKMLADGGLIVYNASLDKVAVWHYDSDPYDANGDGVLDGSACVFQRDFELAVDDSNSSTLGQRTRESVGPVDPTRPDSDSDGVPDGREGFFYSENYPVNWDIDYDGDGYVSAVDSDADGDEIPDGTEDLNGNGTLEPGDWETSAFAPDTDGDGTPDGADPLPLDQDNDGLAGYEYHAVPAGLIYEFYGVEHKTPGRYTYYTNPDSDGDGLLDGEEDADHNATVEADETDPLDLDTDDDGLWDGPLVRTNASNITVPIQQFTGGQNVTNATAGGRDSLFFDFGAWYTSEVNASYALANLSLAQYVVTINATALDAGDDTARTFTARLDGVSWWRTTATLAVTAPNWTELVIGHLLVGTLGNHSLTIASDKGGFYLSNLTLTPVNLSEGWFGTDPLSPASDGDSLYDGGEVGLNESMVTGSVSDYRYTLLAQFHGRTTDSWSDPTLDDTDSDDLQDGSLIVNGTEMGEDDYGTSPTSADSDGDYLSDFEELFETFSEPLSNDTDGDWLLDPYEAMIDQDNDTHPAVQDYDADNNDTNGGNWTRDYNSTEAPYGLELGLTAVFRTNASRGEYWHPGTWIAVNISHLGALEAFVFEENLTSLTNFSTVTFGTHLRADGDASGDADWYTQGVRTFEGYPVLYNGSHVALRLGPNFAYGFRARIPGSDPLPLVDPRPTLWNATETNFKYRETLNWSAVFLGADDDGDGLNVAEEQRVGTSSSNPDSDGDDFLDGHEVYGWLDPISGSVYRGNPRLNDTDGDNLTDGFEIRGWGAGRSSDPSEVDTDHDGAWDGNFTWGPEGMPNITRFELGEWKNSSDPLDRDSDDDGIPDGWELTYGFNASNASDARSDACGAADYDCADNWQEYFWNSTASNETVNASTRQVWWNGTNPLKLDTDDDTMPDGWEMYFDLEPRNASDKNLDPDDDYLDNAQEYNWSILSPWNTSRSWDPFLSANPRLNDTDFDGIWDYAELVNLSEADFDSDGIPSAVDNDSDADGLYDSIEANGWRVEVVDGPLGRDWLSGRRQVNPDDAPWHWSTSDPFDADTDNDGVGDAGEFANFSDPRAADTDGDGLSDLADFVWSPVHRQNVSTSTVVDLEPPELHLDWMRWDLVDDCGGHTACANISFTFTDNRAVSEIHFRNLGVSSAARDFLDPRALNLRTFGDSQTMVGWIWIPLTGAAQYKGQFDILVEAGDRFGNWNRSIFRGGVIYEKYLGFVENVDVATLEKMRTSPETASCPGSQEAGLTGKPAALLCIREKAEDLGWSYGFDLNYAAVFAGANDWFHRRPDVPEAGSEPCEGWCMPSTPTYREQLQQLAEWKEAQGSACAFNETFDFSTLDPWLNFVTTVGPSLDPFEPTDGDLVNLTTTAGMYSLYCLARDDPAHASSFAIWLQGFYKGVQDGGWAGTFLGEAFIALAVASVIVLSILVIAALSEALVGLVAGLFEAGEARALIQADMMVSAAAVEGAGGEMAASGPVLRAVAGEADTILLQEGGAVVRAARAARLIAADPKGLGGAAGLTVEGMSDAELAHALVESGAVRRVEALDAIGFEAESAVTQELAEVSVADLVYAQPTLTVREIENAVTLRVLRGPGFVERLMQFSGPDRRILLRIIDYERSPAGDAVAQGRVMEAMGRNEFETYMKSTFTDFNAATDRIIGDVEMRTNQYKSLFLQADGSYRYPDFAYIRAGQGGYTIRGIGTAKGNWDPEDFLSQLSAIRADTRSLAEAYPNAKGAFVSSMENIEAMNAVAFAKPGSQAELLQAYLKGLQWETKGVTDFHGTYHYFRSPLGGQ